MTNDGVQHHMCTMCMSAHGHGSAHGVPTEDER